MTTLFLVFGIFVAIASILASTVLAIIANLRYHREKDNAELVLKTHQDFMERVAQSQQFTVDMWNEIFKEFSERVGSGIPIGLYIMDPSAELKAQITVDPGNFSVLMAHVAQNFGEMAPIAPLVHQQPGASPQQQNWMQQQAPGPQPSQHNGAGINPVLLQASPGFPQEAMQSFLQQLQTNYQGEGFAVNPAPPAHGYTPSNRPVISSENPHVLQHLMPQQATPAQQTSQAPETTNPSQEG